MVLPTLNLHLVIRGRYSYKTSHKIYDDLRYIKFKGETQYVKMTLKYTKAAATQRMNIKIYEVL